MKKGKLPSKITSVKVTVNFEDGQKVNMEFNRDISLKLTRHTRDIDCDIYIPYIEKEYTGEATVTISGYHDD